MGGDGEKRARELEVLQGRAHHGHGWVNLKEVCISHGWRCPQEGIMGRGMVSSRCEVGSGVRQAGAGEVREEQGSCGHQKGLCLHPGNWAATVGFLKERW